MTTFAKIIVRIVEEGNGLALVALPDPDGQGESMGWVSSNALERGFDE